MKCPKCQAQNPGGMNFCGKCGSELSRAIKSQSETYDKPQSYTPKHLAEKILKSKSSIIGEKKFVTVLFADVANYTSMSEKLGQEIFTPQEPLLSGAIGAALLGKEIFLSSSEKGLPSRANRHLDEATFFE